MAQKPAKVVLLSGGSPQIAKADGAAPVKAYVTAMPGWKHDVGRPRPSHLQGLPWRASRRHFLRNAGIASLATAKPSAAQTPIQRTGKAWFAPALNAYSFLEPLAANRNDPAKGGALVDTGKYATADPYADIAMLVPHAVNWQIKETLGSSLKSPPTDFTKLVRIIRDGGYRGFLPIETLSMGRKDYDPATEVVKVLTALREAIAALA